MNVALFGGTFDPIHCGHLSAARAARDLFSLDCVHFIPAGRPPHRGRGPLTAFAHRYAMVALACAGERGFAASLAEAPSGRPGKVNYSIDTVRRFRRPLAPSDRLFFIVGADAFLDFRTWRDWRRLLNAADFLIVSRPGFPLDRVKQVIPGELLRDRRAGSKPAPDQVQEFRLRRTTAWLLAGVWEPVSATEVRRRARAGKSLSGLVPEAVAEYVSRQGLYQ